MVLQKKDWIDAAWNLMADKGVTGVKVEVLARQLKVSKGSFYWHFKNRKELLEAVLSRWENETTWLIEESEKAATPESQIIKLFSLTEAMCNLPDPEAAIFIWAYKDVAVQKRVRAVEVQRVNHLTKLLKNFGFDEIEARQRARIGYFALMGFWERGERDKEFDFNLKEFGDFLLDLLLSPTIKPK